MIARRQYTPFYQLANAIGGTGGYRWADLYQLWAKVEDHSRWLDLLSLVDPNNADIHFTSMALMDAIVAVRNLSMTQAIESAADRTLSTA